MSDHDSFTMILITKKKTEVFWSLMVTLIWFIGNRLDETDYELKNYIYRPSKITSLRDLPIMKNWPGNFTQSEVD